MSGAVSIVIGLGAVPGIVSIPGDSIEGIAGVGAQWVLSNNGTYSIAGGSGNWVVPASSTVAAYYEAKVDVTSGSFGGGSAATGSWLDLGTSRTWLVSSTGAAIFTASIREKASGAVRQTRSGIQIVGGGP